MAVQYVNGGATISHRTYGYYPDGQMSWFNKTADGSTNTLENNRGDAYTYQADGSLAGVKHESLGVYNGSPNAQGDSTPNGGTDVQRTNNYQYDAAGNRTYADESGTVQDTTYTNENLHYSYSYDDNRNVTTGVANNGIWQYRYDGFNQLLEARPYPYTSVTASFVYDPKGRLCQRTVAGVTTRLYYAGDQVVEERDANNQRTCAYFYGAGGERVGRLYASGAAVFFHYDARGFVTHLTDLGHNVLEQYLYDAFGQPLVYYAATGGQTAATYQGQASRFAENRCLWAQDYEWYPELGLYRCGARFFNPHAAHWLQPDPIGQAGGLNLYAYCGNDPINQVDPSGLLQDDAPKQSTGATLSNIGTLPDGQTIDMNGAGVGPGGGAGIGPGGTVTVIANGSGLSRTEYLQHGVDTYGGFGDRAQTAPNGVGEPSFAVSLIPVVGNAWSAANAFQTGHPWQGAFYSAMAVSDVFLVKSLATAAVKGVAIVGTKLMVREAICETGCFPAGTEVYTEHGNVPIEQVKAGEWVLAQVEGTNYQEWKQVLATSLRTVHHLVVLEVAGERLETTLEHPFWVEGRGWVPAGQLCEGDALLDREGVRQPIGDVTIEAGEWPVYNFLIADDHDYFVGQHHLLVHNGLCSVNARLLAEAMEFNGVVRPAETATHHIVASGSKSAAEARAVLQEFGIGINDASNGVFLPATKVSANPLGAAVHSTLHTGAYYKAVNNMLLGATTREEALSVLDSIGQSLLSGGL